MKATGKTLFPPYEIKTFDGVPVAFIGLTLKGTPEHHLAARPRPVSNSATKPTPSMRWCRS